MTQKNGYIGRVSRARIARHALLFDAILISIIGSNNKCPPSSYLIIILYVGLNNIIEVKRERRRLLKQLKKKLLQERLNEYLF